MRPKRGVTTIGLIVVFISSGVLAWYLLAGINNTSNSSLTGSISGRISGVGVKSRAISRLNAKPKALTTVYAYPASTPVDEMLPDPAAPHAAADAKGEFKIECVPAGEIVLVIDYDSNGLADDRKSGINVRAGITSKLGYVDGAVVNLKEEFYPDADGKRPKKSLKMLMYLPPGFAGAAFATFFILLLMVRRDYIRLGRYMRIKHRKKTGNKG